jgi:hypothetical protein
MSTAGDERVAPIRWHRSTLFLELFYPADDSTEDVLRCA